MPSSTQTVTVCRCGVGYIPPEAHKGAALTTAADIYQFGGLCYYMAKGSHLQMPCHCQTMCQNSGA